MESMQGVLNDSASGRFKANKIVEGDSRCAVRTGSMKCTVFGFNK
jgi:hypothetical protein